MEDCVKIIFLLVFVINFDPSQSITCQLCDSITTGQENCGYISDSQNTCESSIGCFTRLYYYNNTENEKSGMYTSRGCIPSGTFSCDDNECVKCTTNNCNNMIFPSDRNKCLTCYDTDCESPISQYCSVHGSNECITFYDEDGEILLKSCYSDIPTPTRELCDDGNYLNCRKCSGGNCNSDRVREGQKCYECNGPDCLDPIKSEAPLVDCRSSCYIGLNDNGEAVRGCASNFNNSQLCTSDSEISSSCYICKGDHCNAILHPKNGRLRCHTCSGTNCEANEDNVEYCPTFGTNERCVSIFSQTEDVLSHRGCYSTLSSAFCTNSTCLTCSYDKCNKDDTKTKNDTCIGCNSNEDSNCLKANLTLERRCSTSSCYSRLTQNDDEFGRRVERGCLADLTGGCNTTDGCYQCQGKNCNNQLLPSTRISCYNCRNEECLTSVTNKLCNQYITNEACVTFFNSENQVVYRDCYADAPQGTRSICDESSNLLCTKCSGSLCNTAIKRRGNKCFRCSGISCFTTSLEDLVDCQSNCYIGLNSNGTIVRDCASAVASSSSCGSQNSFCMTCADDYCNGILYPTENRKMCIKCSGRDCLGNLDEKSEFCEVLTSSESCVTVFDSNNTVTERGCSSSIISNCTGSSCISCSLNNCNTHSSIAETFYCVSCDSENDPSCINQVISPHIKACSTNQCYSRLVNETVRKGCVSDEPCTGSSCTSCTGDLCNNKLYPSDRLSCLSCVGSGCSNATTKYCSLYSQNNQACITIFNEINQVSYRDCYSDAAEGTKNLCDDPTSLTCTKCTSNNCNTDVNRRGHKCFQCEDASCFNDLNYPADVIDCTSSCYVGLNPKGETVRGCADKFINSSLCDKSENGTGSCFICDHADFCNQIKYPLTNRLTCYKCTDGCEAIESKIDYCEVAGGNERCVTAFDSLNNVIERGCSMTLLNQKYCDQNYKNCIQCSGANCNKITSRVDRLCVECNSATDPNCVLNPSLVSTNKICSSTCYTRVASGDLSRGCLEDLQGAECTEDNLCKSCSGFDKCNIENYPQDRHQCFTCSDSSCMSISSKPCIKYQNNDKCVTIFNGYTPSHRGCLSDQTQSNQALCSNSSALCSSCASNNCNSDSVRKDEQCTICNSNTEPNCAQRPETLAKNHCEVISNGECFSRIMANGATQRGCKGSLLTDEALCRNNTIDSQCMITLGANQQIIPTNRLRCFACDSRMDGNCPKNQTMASLIIPCRNFVRPEQCVKISYTDGRVVRGCQSDFPSSTCSDAKCDLCSNDNGCNFNTASKVFNKKIVVIFAILTITLRYFV